MRDKYNTCSILLCGEAQRNTAITKLMSVPLDAIQPIEIVIRESPKARKLDQNAAYWAGPLSDIAEQAYIEGRTYSANAWHYYFKQLYLPEGFNPELCKEGYRKWDYSPTGERILVGSTTQLTIKGFSNYLTQVEAHGASMGVLFHTAPSVSG